MVVVKQHVRRPVVTRRIRAYASKARVYGHGVRFASAGGFFGDVNGQVYTKAPRGNAQLLRWCVRASPVEVFFAWASVPVFFGRHARRGLEYRPDIFVGPLGASRAQVLETQRTTIPTAPTVYCLSVGAQSVHENQ